MALSLAAPTSHQTQPKTSDIPNTLPASPPPSSPYVKTFQIANKSGDPLPLLIAPGTNRTVWIAAVGRNVSQIINFTAGRPTVVATLKNAFPPDLVYDNITTDSSKRVWILENNSLAYYNPFIKNITIAYTFDGTIPAYMTIDQQDHFWITLPEANQIAEYFPSNGSIERYSVPTPNAGLQGITVSRIDGTIWFAEAGAGKIGHLIPCGSSPCPVTDYGPSTGPTLSGLLQVAIDDNGTVWFTIHDGNEFGSFNPSTLEWRVLPIGYCSQAYVPDCEIGLPNAIALDSHGQVWFSEHVAGRIGRYYPSNGTLIEYMIPPTSAICHKSCLPLSWWMSPGTQNLVWFVALGLGEIGYVNASLPVHFNVTSQPELVVPQGESAVIDASTVYEATRPSINASATTFDTITNPPMLSFSVGQEKDLGSGTAYSLLTVLAAWNATLGPRYVAVTAYDENVTVNTFVSVEVVPCTPHFWSCPTSLGLYTTIGFAGGITASTAAIVAFTYTRRKRSRIPFGQNSEQPPDGQA